MEERRKKSKRERGGHTAGARGRTCIRHPRRAAVKERKRGGEREREREGGREEGDG